MNPALNDYVMHEGKKLRKGYTTGSCAAAAAKAAAWMLLQSEVIDHVSIVTPSGVTLYLDVVEAVIEQQCAQAAIRKDGGDDIDATDGMLIYASVHLNDSGIIQLEGGEGVGRVTRKGIPVAVGEAAINPVPRQMIEQEVRSVIGAQRGAEVLIFAPEGGMRARKTYNPRLGIEGGISILGTSGIVVPMSEESLKKSLSLELEIRYAEGLRRIVLVPGNHGERYAKLLQIPSQQVVRMSNFVGYMLKEAHRIGFEQVALVGHFGKLIKVAAGVFHTHSHIADARIETLITHLALLGAETTFLQQIYACNTTEEAMVLIEQMGLQAVYHAIALRIKQRVEGLFAFSEQPLQAETVLLAYDESVLGSSCELSTLQQLMSESPRLLRDAVVAQEIL